MPFVNITFTITTLTSSFAWSNYLLLFGLTIKNESYITITPKMSTVHKSQYNTFIILFKLPWEVPLSCYNLQLFSIFCKNKITKIRPAAQVHLMYLLGSSWWLGLLWINIDLTKVVRACAYITCFITPCSFLLPRDLCSDYLLKFAHVIS
jgi:hypothetical protein